VKARKVKGLDPDGSFRENAQRIAAVRIAEVWGFGEHAEDPREREALHDMRIAAKRLRYLLEITEISFGAPAKKGAKMARELQDMLGEIHDCDVMSERVRARADALPVVDPRYVGLEALASYLDARRRVLHRQFVTHWKKLEHDRVRPTLEDALGVAHDRR
jgi:CHAD domain-containing protein